MKTESFLDLKEHIATEHNITQSEKLQYKCYDCQKIIPRYNYFLNHIRSKHHPALKLRCEACDLCCQTFEELSQHRSVNCADAKNYETLLPCNHCFKSFYNNFGLQYHCKSQHTTPKIHVKYQCLHCEKQFQNKNTFKAHERLHTGNVKLLFENETVCYILTIYFFKMEIYLFVIFAKERFQVNLVWNNINMFM